MFVKGRHRPHPMKRLAKGAHAMLLKRPSELCGLRVGPSARPRKEDDSRSLAA